MRSLYHITLGMLYGVIILLPFDFFIVPHNYWFPPILNLYPLVALGFLIMGSLIPDHDQPSSRAEKEYGSVVKILQNWLYNPIKRITGEKDHRKITHGLLYNFFAFLILLSVFTLVIIILQMIISVWPNLKDYSINTNLILFLGGVGYLLGLSSHLWLDSISVKGLVLYKWDLKGYMFQGTYAEDFVFALLLFQVLVGYIIVIPSIYSFSELGSLATAILMLILLWISGRTLRSEGFFYLWVPTQVCKKHKGETKKLWILKDGEHGLFWGHRDYENTKQKEIITCRDTKKYNDESELLQNYPRLQQSILKMYLRLRKDKRVIHFILIFRRIAQMTFGFLFSTSKRRSRDRNHQIYETRDDIS